MATAAEDSKVQVENIEHSKEPGHVQNARSDGEPHLRSKVDDLSVWETAKRQKLVTLVALCAAFSASLDGYQINLNGGIVSNKGFIKQMAPPGTKILNANWVGTWGGLQSTGQTIGQMVLPFATEKFGRKVALYIIWITLCASVFAESFATNWKHWLVAKLLSGCGVGMLQATMPVYLSEIAPTNLRGLFIDSYSLWFVVGQLAAAIALNGLNEHDPLNFRTPIYTQWAMVGGMGIIFLSIPESPWWLVGKGKVDKAAKILQRYNGHLEGYNASETINIMSATIEEERQLAEQNIELGQWAVFKGRNRIRFFIASYPKIVQQLVGLTVFNTYATYFFQVAGNKNPFLVTVILTSCQLLSLIITGLFTDQFGRRPLTVYPYGVTVVSVLCLGIMGTLDYAKKDISSLLVFFACLATFSTTGASAIGYAYAAEVPTQRLRARTAGWALALSNCLGIIFSNCTPLMIHGKAKWGVKTGFFFAASGSIAVVISWFLLPEVARRTPAEIDELFEKKVPLRKFKNYVTDVQVNSSRQNEKEV